MLARWLLIWVLALPLAGACSQPAIQQAADALLGVQRQLLAVRQEEMDTRVPLAARQGIVKMKDAIAQTADTYMACRTAPLEAKQIEDDLSALIPATGDGYGAGLTFMVAISDDLRRLVSITPTFFIHCGSDSMLLIYAPHENSWRQVLRWQSPPYDEVSGAFWSFQHRISPGEPWFVVTSRVMPWCSSTWSNIEYAILRPGMPVKVLLHRSESMWWGGDDFGTLAVTRDSAEVRYHSNSIDLGIHNRLFIRRFQISGDFAKRTQLVAISARDFVDEWLVSPWTEARQWSASGLASSHAQMQKRGFEFVSAQKCSDSVQVAATDTATDAVLYFRVAGTTQFTMTEVRTTPDPRCSGPNILDTMSTK